MCQKSLHQIDDPRIVVSMRPNHSPWIAQLNLRETINHLSDNRSTDIAIVGGGIAGISTAYFTLKSTDLKVAIVEADKVAHGATGHNAGQIVSYFERQLQDLVREYGLEMTAQAQRAVDSAWGLMDAMYKEAKLTVPVARFNGYAGCQDLEEVIVHLENNKYASDAQLTMEMLLIAEDSDVAKNIPEQYVGLYSLVPHETILSLLETENRNFIAALAARKGVMNSAMFCEQILDYLFITYPDRFVLFEESPVTEVFLERDNARLKVRDNELTAKNVILCTNGFERFTITNAVGDDIDTQFHHLVRGSVGYMAAYLEENTRPPVAISYLPSHTKTGNDLLDAIPYFYLTRRTFEGSHNETKSLICIGGPEVRMDDTNNYKKEHPYPSEAQELMDTFLHETYKYAPKDEITYQYKWHGLMGYTPNGVRCIGPEPINPVLHYNLGCNGIGILPSIYGGMKISQYLKGEALEKSIFDPQDSRISTSQE